MTRKVFWTGLVAVSAVCAVGLWFFQGDDGDARLAGYIHQRPQVPIVFTSRTEPASFQAAAPDGESFVYPGQRLWQAREGRLRLLTPRGTVHELTWGRPLADGTTLVDVMSPSLSPDGAKIVFAGRKGGNDHGHFRLYEVGLNGKGLRQLTGGPEDAGCTAVPPMRYAAANSQSVLTDAERRAVDYDDVDPIYLNFADGRLCFVSSRDPDLGRGHARRSTTLWLMQGDGSNKRPLTANRNNDRWPFQMTSYFIAFSLWSRNTEVINADERGIAPHEPGTPTATAPTDMWSGAFTQAVGSQFGLLAKPRIPVWRPRPLFNGKIVFMTAADYPKGSDEGPGVLQVMQAEPGLIQNVPSARRKEHALPEQAKNLLSAGPAHDTTGRPLSLATPSPCPPHHVVLAGAPLEPGETTPAPEKYGLYLVHDNWQSPSGQGVTAAQTDFKLLFDDPHFVDAEPVAAYVRPLAVWDKARDAAASSTGGSGSILLANGTTYQGPAGQVFNSDLYVQQVADLPGQTTDAGTGPIFDAPPEGSMATIAVYASRRDRFDDPVQPRVPGAWELLAKVPTRGKSFGAWLPAGVPTVLAGLDADGKVARWSTQAKDLQGHQAAFYAFAGDHYSAVRPNGQHFCVGCHPGHSSMSRQDHRHAERMK